MTKNWLVAGAAALTMGMTATVSYAQTTTVPGEQVGLAVGAPLPEGVYAIDTFLYRMTPDTGPSALPVDVGVNIPVLVWSTPWQPLGGRIEAVVAPPTVFAFGKNGGPNGIRDLSINVGTFVGGIWAFDLGNNFGVSLLGGAYLNELNGDRGVLVNNAGAFVAAPVLPQLASNTYRFGIAGSYTGDGWNLTANLTANIYDSPAKFPGLNTPGFGNTRGPFIISDALNLDLTATKKFGKFEIGAIGYGTYNFDISARSVAAIINGGPGRGRFALGGLIGYDFGPFTAQVYAARDVVTSLPRGENTEVWGRVIVPLYTAAAAPAPAPAPIIRKY
ncbi:transporter [Methylobacterium nodulans]|uniref:CoxB-like protein n=1 Tax=Methylobacterium nodulans (strain LMG 21967 / CNCM I-2342 / ORS 2060) TaxID=460265 RepID=B8ITE5_METNO|nr:transporter [Methylobacterium nodulans]ACL57031.1 conserved hypothetical protein [Methylobacterium nodulans ORS 2060]